MPIFRIRFVDKHGLAHTVYHQQEHAPSQQEANSAIRQHLLNLNRGKDTAPAISSEADDTELIGVDRLPS